LKSPEHRRAAILDRFPRWPNLTIAGLFDLAAAEHGARPAILTVDEEFTYNRLQEESRALASGLIELGLQPGDHVAIVMANFPEFPLVKLALARIGAVAVPVNYALRRDELRYVVEQSRSRFLVGMAMYRDRDYLADFLAIRKDVQGLERIIIRETNASAGDGVLVLDQVRSMASLESDRDLARCEAAASGCALSDIVYTSGTTGHPKGAMVTHDMVLRAAFSSALTRSFEDGRRIQFALPMYHVFGYVECWIASLFVGGCIVPHPVFDASTMLDWAERLETTDMVCVPVMTEALIQEARARTFHSPALLSVFNSGGVNPPSIWQYIREDLGAREIHTAYGMTETTASAMCTWTEDPEECLLETNGRTKLAGVAGDESLGGRVALYRAVDPETGLEVPIGVDGELQVRGPIVTRGYYERPDETAAAFTSDGWFRTGDLGRLIEGGYLRLTGRIKEAYRCGGEMVMPREIETLLADFPGTSQVLAVGIPDPRMGEVGCLCVVPEPGLVPDTDAMIALCAERLARFKVPRHAVLIRAEDIPVTATGRPQKFRLAKLAAELVSVRIT
jgi:fatty-acyl-CoA synthase